MIAVSECLRGTPCRYDGMAKPNKGARELVKAGAVCICPEVLGGLDTPRSPAEIQGGDGFDVLCGKAKVVNKAGEDVTAQYVKGAEIVLELCKKVRRYRGCAEGEKPLLRIEPHLRRQLYWYTEAGRGRYSGAAPAKRYNRKGRAKLC